MPETPDSNLLQSYLRDGSQPAFAELVARHADWIYSMALRLVRDRQLAEDVTQAVFLALVQNGHKLTTPNLRSWLFKATRHVAANAIRAESRRTKHQRLAAMTTTPAAQPPTTGQWDQIAPRLDELIAHLRKTERDALLLRFYQSKSLAEVGSALGVSEEAARKRIARAIDKLRDSLRIAGISVPAAALAITLADNTTHAAPIALKASCASLSASSAATSFAQGVQKMILKTKLITAGTALAAMALLSTSLAAILLAQTTGSLPASHVAQAAAMTPPATTNQPPATMPAANTDDQQMEGWWADLAESDPQSSQALLHFYAAGEKTVAFLQTKMLPLTITPERVRGLINQLGSNDDAVWKPAFDELSYFDPRLAIDLQTLMNTVTTSPARQRLVAILSGREPEMLIGQNIRLRHFGPADNPQYNFFIEGRGSWWAEPQISRLGPRSMDSKKYWTRAIRGLVLLDQIGTPDAIALVSQMATGNPDAQPTQIAKELLAGHP